MFSIFKRNRGEVNRQQTDAGVLMDYEILTVSRSVPFLLRWMVTPIINRESRRAQLDMLQAMRTKLPVLAAPQLPTAAGEGPV